MALGSHFNVWNTCLHILQQRGFAISVNGEVDADGSWPTELLWTAEKDGFRFMGDNPIELLGLVGVYDHVQPAEDAPYWWHADCDDLRREAMRKAFPAPPAAD